MKEIEVKILDINRQEIVEKLLSLGAKKVFDGEIHALFFDNQDGSIKKNNIVLRLRRMGDRFFLAFKRRMPHEAAQNYEEYEAEVSNFDDTKKILDSLGFSVWLTMKKHRTSYQLEDVHFELDKHHDQFAFVPEFLEIEAKEIETVHKYAEILGFKKEDCLPWTILEAEEHYSKEKTI